MTIRLNKVFKATHSRRQADVLIASGRVSVNHRPITEKGGIMVRPHVDVVHLDGKQIDGWESLNAIPHPANEATNGNLGEGSNPVVVFEYVKYWKPRGVTCTTDQRIEGNIIDEIAWDGYRPKHRVYPVGRLDKDTSGLILLTNDGRLPNAFLRSQQRKAKVYNVLVDRPLEHNDLEQLRVRRRVLGCTCSEGWISQTLTKFNSMLSFSFSRTESSLQQLLNATANQSP
jgi:23S rRNA pseudouridine2604 synthase